jgi:hypothetical protein
MQRKKFPWIIIHILIVIIILLIAALPLISVAIAGSIANANGCQLDEGSIHPCVVNGQDMGETLYSMGVMGWFMLVTIPLGLGAALLYIIVVVAVTLIRRLARNRRAAA